MKKKVSAILYEYMHTTYQSGPGLPNPIDGVGNFGYKYGGRDDYYNNYFYSSGWTYKDRIIGTPLFMTSQRAEYYFNELENYGEAIINNRVVAHHVGMEGFLSNSIQYKIMTTYTRNFGTYAGLNQGRYNWASRDPSRELDYTFALPLDQVYLLLEFNTKLNKQLALQTAFGYDFGDMTHNFGMLLELKWSGMLSFVKREKMFNKTTFNYSPHMDCGDTNRFGVNGIVIW